MKHKINKELLGKRLKQLMHDYQETTYSLGRKFNLSPPTISRYTRGEMLPKMTTINALADYFSVNPDWLTGESNNIYEEEILDNINSDNYSSIPIFESVKYDLPVFSNKKTKDDLNLPVDKLTDWGAVIGLKVPDNAMHPIIQKDDHVAIKLNPNYESNKLCAIHANHGDLKIRRIVDDGNYIILQPDNLEYNAEVYKKNRDDIQIIGQVVYCRHIEEAYY